MWKSVKETCRENGLACKYLIFIFVLLWLVLISQPNNLNLALEVVGKQLQEDSKLKLPEIPTKVSDYQTSVVLMIVIDTIKLEEALQMDYIPALFQTPLSRAMRIRKKYVD